MHARRRWWWVGVVAAVVVAVAVGVGVAANGDHPAPSAAVPRPPASNAVAPMRGHPASPSTVCENVADATVMGDGMVMAPVPARAPTTTERAAAARLAASVSNGIAKYADLRTAVAAGYVPATNPNGWVVHYANWDIVRSGDVLDPQHPSSLVYAHTLQHGTVLLGAMFLGPGPCTPGPDVAGPLTAWHAHDNLCLSASLQVVGRATTDGSCVEGRHNVNTFFMLHVWTEPSLASRYQFEAHVPTDAYRSIIVK